MEKFKISMEAARVNAHLTQQEAAKLLGISNKTLCKWELGKSYPTADFIPKICKLYNMPYDYIDFLPTNSLKEN